jgi:hypothetical protein
VLAGRPTLRHPDGEDELEPGDVVCFPSDKIGIWPNGDEPAILRREPVDYWKDER